MKKKFHCVFYTAFLLFFVCYLAESQNDKFLKINKRDYIFGHEDLDKQLNYSLKASCNCKNGDCDDKGCVCWPDYGKVSENECQACNCGKGHGCIITTGWFGKTTCICKKGFVQNGSKCVDIDTACECGNGICIEEDGKAVCKCKPMHGFIEKGKKCVACNCGEGWNCTYSYSGTVKFCTCTNGYTQKGNGMDKKCVGPCTNNPCENGGTCVDDAPGKYKCECLEGFAGSTCNDIVKTPCSSNPCMNGAVCKNVDKSYECKCTTGFAGRNCDKDDICYKNPGICRNGGTCETTLPGGYICTCPPSFSDSKCRNGCEERGGSEKCAEKGEHWTCVNEEQDKSKYICICEPGYKPDSNNCIEDIYECKPTDCTGENTECETNSKYYTCECKEGFKPQDEAKKGQKDAECIIKTGCEGYGGNDVCQKKGDFFTCNNYKYNASKYTCDCIPGYKIDKEKCVVKTGCEDYGGKEACQKKGDFFTCNNEKINASKYTCACLPGYKIDKEKCIVKTGCEDYGGKEVCQKKGDLFTCNNDKINASKYLCDCVPGYKIDKEKCVAQTGCEDDGGNKECQEKGEFFTCINDEQDVSKYKCECQPGYKIKNRKCVALTGCEDNGGNKECQEKGEFFTCINDEQDVSKYRCECQPGYKIKNRKCVALTGCEDNGGNKECQERGEFFTCINDEQDVSKYRCECRPGYIIKNKKCVAYLSSSTVSVSSDPTSTRTISNSSTTEISTTEVQRKKCDCGDNSYSCQWNEKGAQHCSCFPGYAQLENVCSECHCGRNTASCFFDRSERNICICRDGFAQRNGTCSKICRSSADCLNGGKCSSDGHESFCKCISPYTGDRCEINEICESMNGACNSIGAVCHYIHSIKQGFCMCPPNKIFNEDLKRCEDKFEITSIFFIILCLSTVLLLLSIVILIILLKKFRKKLESLNGKSP
nr:neurogenic locus Notch protein-like isoform X2 [Parasteatoda tepidariorum]